MNILKEILVRYGQEVLKDDIHAVFQRYFDENIANVFLLNRHGDPGMKEREKVKVKIAKSYPNHVLVDVLNRKDEPLYQTTIAYTSLLDRDNTNHHGTYELIKIFTRVSIIRDDA